MGLFDFFKSKKTRTVVVGGSLSRVREDAFIKNTTGLIVSAALINNQNLADALILNAATGTISSYRAFNRRCKNSSEIGLPTTDFTYSTIDRDALSLAIRTATGLAYPISSEIADLDVSLEPLTSTPINIGNCAHLQYHLQESYSYNLTTNIFTYLTIDYYGDSYADIGSPHTSYTVNGHRTKVITTTTTSAITVYYDVGEAKWKHKDTVTTDVSYVYDPPGATGSSSSSVDNITDYNTGTNPYGLDLSDTGVTFNICILGGFEYLCNPSVVVTYENDPVSFTLVEARPETTILTTYQAATTTQERTNDYWVVYYVHLGRRYIWIDVYDAQTDSNIFVETTNALTPNPYLIYAPIVAVRYDAQNYSPTYEPTKYNQANRCLKIIGLSVDAITENIDSAVNGAVTVEDAYVSLFSQLKTNHIDQLAYNYAFFDYMESISVNTETEYNDTFTTNTSVYSFNRLIVGYTGIFHLSISWSYIKKTSAVVGALTNDYEYSLTASTRSHWVTNNTTAVYVIKKKTSANTYDEIEVANFMMEYNVNASGGDSGIFTVGMDTGEPEQLVIPVSYSIAEDFVPRRYLETFYLRSTYIGIFSKQVQVTVTKWYQQGWFADLLKIGAIILAVYTGYYYLTPELIAATAATYAVSTTVATFIIVAKFAIIQYSLKAVLVEVFKATDNSFLRILATVAAIYVTLNTGSDVNLLQQSLTVANTALDAVSLANQIDLKTAYEGFKDAYQELEALIKSSDIALKEFKDIEAAQALGAQAIEIFNLFRDPSESLLTQADLDAAIGDPSYLPNLVSNHVTIATELPNPASIFIASDKLLNNQGVT